MGSICTSIHVSINRMKTLGSIIFFASILNWIEGAPFSKLSSHDAILLSASHSGDICKNLELQESEHHLLADPEDCKKFFSCQYSRSGWLAYRMNCADGTHFDGVYCVTGDSCVGIDLVNKEDPKLKYYTSTPESTSTSTTTEIPSAMTTTEIPTTTMTTTEIPTTTMTTEILTTITTTEIPTTTMTTEIPTTTIATEIPTTTIATEIPTTTIVTTEIP